jgi:DNA mismatch repair ATPase MutS
MGGDRLVFDYKIKEGLLKNRNGIAVLKGLGFPDSIIDEANKVSIQLRDKYDL